MFSTTHLIIAGVIALLLFGPDKLPQLAHQLGKALRELNRAKDSLADSFKMDEEAPRYHSYDNTYNPTPLAPLPEEVPWNPRQHLEQGETSAALTAATEPLRGDFAAAALADTADDYGQSASPAPVAPTAPANGAVAYNTNSPAHDVTARPAEGAVPRS